MGIGRSSFALALGLASAAVAGEELNLSCSGENWSLELRGTEVQFSFMRDTQMEVMLDTPAEGQEWPRAMTLIGERDSGVLIIDVRACGASPYSAEVLTQRSITPILLVGCCEALE